MGTSRHAVMSDREPSLTPEPGDFVVAYHDRRDLHQPRLVLGRISEDGSLRLVRSTFSSPEDAGPRFEDEARLMAAASGSRSLRCVDGRSTAISAPPSSPEDHDASDQ